MHFVSELLADKGRQIFSVHPGSTVLDAVREMDKRRVGALLVLDGERPVGIISERDYARRVILMGRRSDAPQLAELMTRELVTACLDSAIDACMELMTEHRVRHLPVVQNHRAVGVVSIGDLVRAIIARQANTIQHLEGYITG